jgi:hypothetical protein
MKSNNRVLQEIMKSDYLYLDKIKFKIEEIKTIGLLPEDFVADTAVNLIYGVLMLNLMMYVYEETCTFDEVCVRIEDGIRFVLK